MKRAVQIFKTTRKQKTKD